jgi:hypothetical protein
VTPGIVPIRKTREVRIDFRCGQGPGAVTERTRVGRCLNETADFVGIGDGSSSGGEPPQSKLYGGDEAGLGIGYAVGHAGSGEGIGGIAIFVEQYEAAGAIAAAGEELHSGFRGARGSGGGGAKKIAGGFGEDHFHDGFAEAGGRDGAGFAIGIAAGADEGRIADASGKLAAGAAGGRGGKQPALLIESDGADGALFVAAMMFGGVRIFAAPLPGFAFGGRDEFFGIAKGNAIFVGELFRTLRDEHHVGTFFEDGARSLNGIFDAAESSDGTGFECGGIHDDGVAFDVAVEIEVGAVACVEDGIIFEGGDGGFDGVERVSTFGEDGVAGAESTKTASFAGFDGVVGDVPGAAVNDEGGLHRKVRSEQWLVYSFREENPKERAKSIR